VLATVDTGFSDPVNQAINGATHDFAAKVAFESPRFWEAEDIYGGLSFPGGGTGPVWYPSSGFGSPRGVLLGAYVAGAPGQAFEALSLSEQIGRRAAPSSACIPDTAPSSPFRWWSIGTRSRSISDPGSTGPWTGRAPPPSPYSTSPRAGSIQRCSPQPAAELAGGRRDRRHRTIALLAQRVQADRLVQPISR